ncbi:TetR family transcriptional regulator [Pseudonocardia sp. ICBG1293]|uniref:TetR family transcriptional regulator n=1 Tax=Pseudonocardia sp. ICBG1293 TaxID=2844382 RepID=UPI001CCDF4B0|nr:TetR family transcriptional regulator [Pseudonocardia sp. ICBG1293]
MRLRRFRYRPVMAWDTEGTRRRLREAATAEFAERGREGTTMSRIAARAGINKERLYSYFGDKDALWDLVLADQLEQLAAGVRATGTGLDDLGAFAGATFDHHAEHPWLARLLQWEGLDGTGHVAARAERGRHYREKVERVAAAQRAGTVDDGVDPAHLVFALIALAAWWHTVPQLASMLTGAAPDDPAERAARRAFVVEAARRLGAPR